MRKQRSNAQLAIKNKSWIRFIAASLLVILITPGRGASVYQAVSPSGGVIYSDTPGPAEIKVTVPPVSHYPSPLTIPAKIWAPAENKQLPPKPTPEKLTSSSKVVYTVSIIHPYDHQLIRDDDNVPVEISINPGLQKKDRIQLLVDGKKYGKPKASNRFKVTDLRIGRHYIQAAVVSRKGKYKAISQSIKFYYHVVDKGF